MLRLRFTSRPSPLSLSPFVPMTFAVAVLALSACAGTGTGEGEPENPPADCEDTFCVLSGTLTENQTLTADKDWLLRGGVFVGDDEHEVVLTIEPGTQVYGESSSRGMLVVNRGSKLMAEGRADAPIVLTSAQNEGERARGDWGGVVLNGYAPVNGCGTGSCESIGEGDTGVYGGDDASDSSGVLQYVRIEFAGALISPDNELNGLGLQGVGNGTTIDHVQVHMAKDDCIEFFGGTADAKHILCTGAADDNLDWTDGWQGRMQFFVSQQYEDAGDNGIEADNNGEDNDASPRSQPTLSNVTVVGVPNSDFSDLGMLIREGSAVHISNAIVTGWNEACFDIDHAATFAQAQSGALTVENSIFDCATAFAVHGDNDPSDATSVGAFVMNDNPQNQVADPMLVDAYATDDARDFRPAAGSPARSAAVIPNDAFFDDVSFIGGVGPNDDWTTGWTTHVRR